MPLLDGSYSGGYSAPANGGGGLLGSPSSLLGGSNFSMGMDPRTMGLLGLAAGMGAASAPSRLPVTLGQVFSGGAQGLLSGNRAALQNQLLAGQLTSQNIANQRGQIDLAALQNYMRQFGGPATTSGAFSGSSNLLGAPQSSGQPSATGATGTAATGTGAASMPSYVDRVAQLESGGNPNATPPVDPTTGSSMVRCLSLSRRVACRNPEGRT